MALSNVTKTVYDSGDDIGKAVALAKTADVAVLVIGLTGKDESEGHDKSDLRLPGNQDDLVANVSAVAKKTVVVVMSGSPVDITAMKESPSVGSIMWY